MMKSGRNTSLRRCELNRALGHLRHLIPCKTEAITYIERVTGSRHTTFLMENTKEGIGRGLKSGSKKWRTEEGRVRKWERGRKEGWRKRRRMRKVRSSQWWRQMMYCYIQKKIWKKIELHFLWTATSSFSFRKELETWEPVRKERKRKSSRQERRRKYPQERFLCHTEQPLRGKREFLFFVNCNGKKGESEKEEAQIRPQFYELIMSEMSSWRPCYYIVLVWSVWSDRSEEGNSSERVKNSGLEFGIKEGNQEVALNLFKTCGVNILLLSSDTIWSTHPIRLKELISSIHELLEIWTKKKFWVTPRNWNSRRCSKTVALCQVLEWKKLKRSNERMSISM